MSTPHLGGSGGSQPDASGVPSPPAGWYPTPTGGQQYWDGTQWLALPPPMNPEAAGAATSRPGSRGASQRGRRWVLFAAAAVLLLGVLGGGVAWKLAADQREAEAAAQAAASSSAAAEQAAEEQKEREREEAAAAAQEERDDAERQLRLESVTEIEASVQEMAEGHVADGIIDGPIIDVTCSPVGGGSTDDLTEQTTVFACFVANEDNGDGTMSGYGYNATMNWSTGEYTYSLGDP